MVQNYFLFEFKITSYSNSKLLPIQIQNYFLFKFKITSYSNSKLLPIQIQNYFLFEFKITSYSNSKLLPIQIQNYFLFSFPELSILVLSTFQEIYLCLFFSSFLKFAVNKCKSPTNLSAVNKWPVSVYLRGPRNSKYFRILCLVVFWRWYLNPDLLTRYFQSRLPFYRVAQSV